jgi:hypothetical protein
MPKKPKVKAISDGNDMFVVVDGLKIAKRGKPGTSHAKTWILGTRLGSRRWRLETIAIKYNGVAIH